MGCLQSGVRDFLHVKLYLEITFFKSESKVDKIK